MKQVQSTLNIYFNPSKDTIIKSAFLWLEDKQKFDGAEGLWRIHDNLYDITDFIKKHPGGEFWLTSTQGLDITEAFESYHIWPKAEDVLRKYFVRKAKTPRASTYTFHEDGFYKTLKKNVRKVLPNIQNNVKPRTNFYIDVAMISAFTTALIATSFWSYAMGILSGFLFSITFVAAHNFYHTKDNFRMLYCELALSSSREARVLHVLSHHMFPNSVADFQIYVLDPLLQFYPHKKTMVNKYLSWIYGPLLWTTSLYIGLAIRLYNWLAKGDTRSINKGDLVGFILPLSMYMFSEQSLQSVAIMWLLIIAVCSTFFYMLATSSAHLHPDIFLDGDQPRPNKENDWGLAQIDTAAEKTEVQGNDILSLFFFGDHVLHHLFPSLDHGYLPHLYPVVQETMKQFNVDIKMTTIWDLIGGYFRRLAIETPNSIPISSSWRKYNYTC